jgi:hypothetical protein
MKMKTTVLPPRWKSLLTTLGKSESEYLTPPIHVDTNSITDEGVISLAKDYLRDVLDEVEHGAYSSAKRMHVEYVSAFDLLKQRNIKHSLPSPDEVKELFEKAKKSKN